MASATSALQRSSPNKAMAEVTSGFWCCFGAWIQLSRSGGSGWFRLMDCFRSSKKVIVAPTKLQLPK